MKAKKVKAPVYEQLADNEYIGGLRNDIGNYRDMTNQYLNNLDVLNPEVQQQYQNIADDFTGAQWSDLSRQYNRDYNRLNQANYNRFGSLGSTGALYNNETLQRDYNDMASRIAANTAGQYQNLINNYYNQKLNTLNAANALYQQAGSATTNLDQANWNIRNNNIAAKYAADVQNARQQNPIIRTITGALNGAGTGGSIGGGWGALAGGIIGGASSAFDTSGQDYNLNIPMIGQNISGLFSNNVDLNTKTNNVASPTNYRTFMGGRY